MRPLFSQLAVTFLKAIFCVHGHALSLGNFKPAYPAQKFIPKCTSRNILKSSQSRLKSTASYNNGMFNEVTDACLNRTWVGSIHTLGKVGSRFFITQSRRVRPCGSHKTRLDDSISILRWWNFSLLSVSQFCSVETGFDWDVAFSHFVCRCFY